MTGLDRLRTLLAVPATSAHAKKPATLSYGLERPPQAAIIWISAIQHVGVCAIFMVYPLIIVRKAGLTEAQTINLLQLGFLALAVATSLQALPRGPIGSRPLAPSIFTGVYLAPSLLAVQAGGLPLVWGMTMFAGVMEWRCRMCGRACVRSFRRRPLALSCFSLERSLGSPHCAVFLTYDGAALEFPSQPPTHEEITETEHGHLRLAGYLIRRQADRTESSRRNGRTVVRLLFDHSSPDFVARCCLDADRCVHRASLPALAGIVAGEPH